MSEREIYLRRLARERGIGTYAPFALSFDEMVRQLGLEGQAISRRQFYRLMSGRVSAPRPGMRAVLERMFREPWDRLQQEVPAEGRAGIGLPDGDAPDGDARARAWWNPHRDLGQWVQMEAEARAIRIYEHLWVPGLLQTPDYARAAIGTARPPLAPDQLDRQLAARLDIVERVLGREDPPQLWVVIDEAVLMRRIGTPEVMAAQLEHLRDLAHRPRIVVQVLRLAGPHAGVTTCSFEQFEFSDGAEITYLDTPSGGLYVRGSESEVYSVRFDYLRAQGLDPDDTCAVLSEIRREATPA